MENFVVISGCSGGGKSTLLQELGRRGHLTVEEPGRRIVKQELAAGGTALPWKDGAAFAGRAMSMALADRAAAARTPGGWVFFDRGLIDAASALQHLTGEPVLASLTHSHRYHRAVFLTPPWREIYAEDGERQHAFQAAQEEYSRLLEAYPALGYEVVLLPKVSVGERADFIERALSTGLPS